MSNIAKILAARLQAKIDKDGWSHRRVAELSGVSNTTISKFLKDFDDVRLSTLEGIAKALSVPVFYLLMTDSERAQWDESQKPKVDLSAIERRLAALEAAKPSAQALSEPPHEPVDLLPELEKLGRELEREIGDPSLKKRGRKQGNG